MKVEAIKVGYYGKKLRNPGDVFTVSNEKAFSKNWMKKVDGETKRGPGRPPKAEAAKDDGAGE